MATVEIVDASGNPLKLDVNGVQGLKPLTKVIVTGKVTEAAAPNLVLQAQSIHIAGTKNGWHALRQGAITLHCETFHVRLVSKHDGTPPEILTRLPFQRGCHGQAAQNLPVSRSTPSFLSRIYGFSTNHKTPRCRSSPTETPPAPRKDTHTQHAVPFSCSAPHEKHSTRNSTRLDMALNSQPGNPLAISRAHFTSLRCSSVNVS